LPFLRLSSGLNCFGKGLNDGLGYRMVGDPGPLERGLDVGSGRVGVGLTKLVDDRAHVRDARRGGPGRDAPTVTLSGRRVLVEPLDDGHRDGLRAAADDERIWKHTLTVARGEGFDGWFQEALDQQRAGRQVPFAVRDVGGRLIGSTSYLDPSDRHRRVEIGSTWYMPGVWGSSVNPECKLLLLQHAFDVCGVNRVSFVTDVLNERSKAAIAKLGANLEGTLRSHMVTQGGRARDSALFSIIADEWPAVREKLTARLAVPS
jgi:RimJ/RimL family protein N-acetyltransferase